MASWFLMVIYNLDLFGVGAGPKEADAPLVFDSNRVLSAPISLECLEAITWRQLEESQFNCGIDQLQLDERSLPDVTWQAARAPCEPQFFGVAGAEAFKHEIKSAIQVYPSSGYYSRNR